MLESVFKRSSRIQEVAFSLRERRLRVFENKVLRRLLDLRERI
jgi:hypothetical protein